jgi:hypothetical protein
MNLRHDRVAQKRRRRSPKEFLGDPKPPIRRTVYAPTASCVCLTGILGISLMRLSAGWTADRPASRGPQGHRHRQPPRDPLARSTGLDHPLTPRRRPQWIVNQNVVTSTRREVRGSPDRSIPSSVTTRFTLEARPSRIAPIARSWPTRFFWTPPAIALRSSYAGEADPPGAGGVFPGAGYSPLIYRSMAHPHGFRGLRSKVGGSPLFPTPTVRAVAAHQGSVGGFRKLLPEARNDHFQKEREALAVVSFQG